MVMIKRYRKKPVVIEAIQWDGENAIQIIGWINKNKCSLFEALLNMQKNTIELETLEGTMSASVDDWIIKGVQGEFYPCKTDIFEASYEAVEDD